MIAKSMAQCFYTKGLAQSYNLSTAKLGLEMGVPRVLKTAQKLGVERPWPAYPSMLLGAGSLTPMEVAAMYQTIANGGFNTPLRAIRSVLTGRGRAFRALSLTQLSSALMQGQSI